MDLDFSFANPAVATVPSSSAVAFHGSDSGETVHLVNPLWDATGGADWRTIDLYRLLSQSATVRLWSEYRVDQAFSGWPVRQIRWYDFPRGGTLVVVGVYFRLGAWVRWSGARRVILIYNTHQPDRLAKTLNRLRGLEVEVIFTSEALRRSVGMQGQILESFVDTDRFEAVQTARSQRPAGPFTVGRLSRDNPRKHHPGDTELYASLAQNGVRVRVMGAGPLRNEPTLQVPGIELSRAGSHDPALFLSTLDAFYYRTHPEYFEAFGRVVLEAMLAGLPVVAEARGGYSAQIRHGENGLLFDDVRDAEKMLMHLRQNPEYARHLGAEARKSALQLFQVDLPRRTEQLILQPRPVTVAEYATVLT